MEVEKQRSELVSVEGMDREEFVKFLVTLVKNNREVREAILELILASPYIVRRY